MGFKERYGQIPFLGVRRQNYKSLNGDVLESLPCT